MPFDYRFICEEPGFCRTLFKDKCGRVYCLQDDGRAGVRDIKFYACSRDGEPSHEVQMPEKEKFDKYVEPK